MSRLYIRGTNNKNEHMLINDGTIRRSKNSITGKEEIGLSVADPSSIKNIEKYFNNIYEVYGKEIAIGSDGEPILDINKLKFKRWIKKEAMSEFTPEEKAEIRKARWDGAKRGLKASPWIGATVGGVNVIGNHMERKSRIGGREEAIANHDAHISAIKARFRPGNPEQQHPVSQENAINYHNDIHRHEIYKRRLRREIEAWNKTIPAASAKTFAASMATLAGVYSALHSHLAVKEKKQEIRARRTKTIDKSASIVDMLKTARSKNVKRMVAKLSPEWNK